MSAVTTEKAENKPYELTQSAINRIVNYAKEKPELEGKYFRVLVEGGGCSGFQYDFIYDDPKADDQILEFDGVKVLLDEQSKPYLSGSIVDFKDDFRGTGFIVQNPNATGSCGCGVSFSV